MNTNDTLQNLLNILKNNSIRVEYYVENPIAPFREDFLKYRKDLLALILKEENPLPLCLRFCWAQSFLLDVPSEEFIGNRIVLLGIFRIAEIGVPFEETPALNQAILQVLQDYATSDIEDPEKIESYENFLTYLHDAYAKYKKDPRFTEHFEAVKWGVYR